MSRVSAPASIKSVLDARAFLLEPCSQVEEVLLCDLARDVVAAGFQPPGDGFVEWGCVEHGVIHVFTCGGQVIIELDPTKPNPQWEEV